MFRNYILIALRNLLKRKTVSSINIFGLAAGMAGSILIMLYLQHEISFDRFNKNCDRIFRLVSERKTPEGISRDLTSPPPLAQALQTDFPQINSVRFLYIDNPIPMIKSGTNQFYEKQLYFADPSVFKIFTIAFAAGDYKTALSKPNSVVITKRAAEKYFGNTDPVGQSMTFNNFLDLEVTGVVENPPSNSTLNFDFLVSFSTLYGWLGKDFVDNWQNNTCQTYVMLPQNLPAESIESQMPDFIDRHFDKSHNLKRIYLQPLNRVHLYSFEDYKLASSGDISYVYLLAAIAFFILIIASFNYVGLTTSQFMERSKEVGVRKLIGATRKQLTIQFLGEGILTTLSALVVSFAVVAVVLPYFSNIVGIDLAFDFTKNYELVTAPVGIALLFGLISSIYPAFFLSSFQPVQVLKSRFKNVTGKVSVRKILVVLQFTLTTVLIIGTIVVYRQINFIQNKKLGFDGDKVIVVPIHEGSLRQNSEPLKNELMRRPGIYNVGASALLPGGPVGKTRYLAGDISNTGTMSMLWIDQDFIKTLGIKMIAGRDFSKEYPSDVNKSIIINEAAVKQLGWKTPSDAIGKTFELVGSKKGKIIGVVKDFNFTSLQNKIDPIVLHIWPWMNYILVRTDAQHLSSVIGSIKTVWKEFEPDNPLEYSLLNDNFNRYYDSINLLEKVSTFFTLIAVVIACLGLFVLSAFTSMRRTKEIGIRKVLGASIYSILRKEVQEFLVLVLIAGLIAWPVAYYGMTQWLDNYAYRIDVGLTTLILASALSLIIALITVGYHAIKSAIANPVEALRYE